MDRWLSFAQALEHERPSLLKYLQRRGVPPPDQRELAGDVILAAWAARDSYDPGRASLRTWLKGIAANVVSHYRRLARHRWEQLHLPEHLSEMHTQEVNAELRLVLKERREVLHEMIEKIPEERRPVFVLYELHEMKLREIAAALSISEDTAWSRLRLARDDLVDIARRWHAAEAHRGGRGRSAVLLPLLASAAPVSPVSGLLHLAPRSGAAWIQAASLGIAMAVIAPHDAGPVRAPSPLPPASPADLAKHLAHGLQEEAAPAQIVEPPAPPPLPRRAEVRVAAELRPRSQRQGATYGEHHLIHLARAHMNAGRYAKALDALDLHARSYPTGEHAGERNRLLGEIRRP
jgi:RNA polymerase sigma-70 factor (ECF subfamily)